MDFSRQDGGAALGAEGGEVLADGVESAAVAFEKPGVGSAAAEGFDADGAGAGMLQDIAAGAEYRHDRGEAGNRQQQDTEPAELAMQDLGLGQGGSGTRG